MKKNVILVLCLLVGLLGSAQNSILQDPMLRLIQASRTPLMSAHSEVVRIESTNWERLYGEKEFALCPSVSNVGEYLKGVLEMSMKLGNRDYSKMSYFDVLLTEANRNKLMEFGISVPDYFQGNSVKVLLPICYSKILLEREVQMQSDFNYGKGQITRATNEIESDVIFYNEGFEIESVPGTMYNSTILGGANCGWGDESCKSYTGSWSVWCSSNGSGCNDCSTGGYHVNNVISVFSPTAWIDISNYSNKLFSYMVWSDLNDLDFTDNVVRYYAFDGAANFSISGDSFTSSSSIDEAGWSLRTASITGGSTYIFGFNFTSDGSFTSDGVYLDDIKMSGTVISAISEQNVVSNIVFPNPAKKQINLRMMENPSKVEILDLNGKVIAVSSFQKQIDIENLSSGIYMLKAYINEEVIIEKFIKE